VTRRRLVAASAFSALVALALPDAASAHGLVGRSDLPIPEWLFGWAAAVVLLISFAALSLLWPKPKLEGDEAVGAQIVKFALDAPLKQIAINAGLEGGVVAEKVKGLPPDHGLNAATGEYENLLDAGVPDPTKVTRSALQNAASIAGLFLTTEAVIADKPEKAPAMQPGGDGGMGGMDF